MGKFIKWFVVTFIKALVESAVGVAMGCLLLFTVCFILGRVDT